MSRFWAPKRRELQKSNFELTKLWIRISVVLLLMYFLILEIFFKWQKLFCFFTPCWRWWHSQVSRLFNYVSFRNSHFEFVFICGCRQRASSWQFQFSHWGSFANVNNTKWLTTCLQGVHEFGMTELKNGTPYHDSGTFVVAPNRGILKTLFNFELQFWPWKSMNHQLRKSVNVAQKKRSSI